MAVPSTATKAVGDKVSASWANNNVKSPIDFLKDPPRCEVFDSTGAISVTNSTFTLLTFDSETLDSDTMHSTSSNTGRITFTTAGRYQVQFYARLPAATYSQVSMNPRLNSGGSSGGGSSIYTHNFGTATSTSLSYTASILFERTFAAGDYVECFLFQTSGGTRNPDAAVTGARARWVAIN